MVCTMYLTEILYIEFLNVNVLSVKLENLELSVLKTGDVEKD